MWNISASCRGEVINGGFGLMLDGSPEAEYKARMMLSWDVSNGVSLFQTFYHLSSHWLCLLTLPLGYSSVLFPQRIFWSLSCPLGIARTCSSPEQPHVTLNYFQNLLVLSIQLLSTQEAL